ncbi:MAG: hypothetical protein NW205_01855 [Hyphomicrobiaceae bacterium]|nr:hypothetical protein [Hyphomicrobiaceae bacterium]
MHTVDRDQEHAVPRPARTRHWWKALAPRGARQAVGDMAVGLALFALLAGLVTGGDARAAPPVFTDIVSMASEIGTSADKQSLDAVAADLAAAVKAVVPAPLSTTRSVFQLTGQTSAMWLIALAFAASFAANAALWRRLRNTYVPVSVRSRRRNRGGTLRWK